MTDFSMCDPEESIGRVFHWQNNPPGYEWGVLVAVHDDDALEMEFEWLDECPEGAEVVELQVL